MEESSGYSPNPKWKGNTGTYANWRNGSGNDQNYWILVIKVGCVPLYRYIMGCSDHTILRAIIYDT